MASCLDHKLCISHPKLYTLILTSTLQTSLIMSCSLVAFISFHHCFLSCFPSGSPILSFVHDVICSCFLSRCVFVELLKYKHLAAIQKSTACVPSCRATQSQTPFKHCVDRCSEKDTRYLTFKQISEIGLLYVHMHKHIYIDRLASFTDPCTHRHIWYPLPSAWLTTS